MPTSGVYYLKVNDGYYIGYSSNYKKQISEHLRKLDRNQHSNKQLQDNYNCTKKLEFKLLRVVSENALYYRNYYIDEFLKNNQRVYNRKQKN